MSDNKEQCRAEFESVRDKIYEEDWTPYDIWQAAWNRAAQPVVLTDEQWVAFKQITDDAETFLNGGVAGLRQSIDNARAILAAKEQA